MYVERVKYRHMTVRRTTIDLDQDLLSRAKQALGSRTTRATVEEALRRAADVAEGAHEYRATRQRRYLECLDERADTQVLASEDMWR
jgi:Arc/MetJ family transcription regulator